MLSRLNETGPGKVEYPADVLGGIEQASASPSKVEQAATSPGKVEQVKVGPGQG